MSRDSKNKGFILLHRSMCDNPLWLAEKFTYAQAWVDLLMLANHMQGQIIVRGITIQVNRGQVGWSQESLAKRWKWSRGKVIRFCQKCEQEMMLQTVQQKNHVTTLFTIVNYDSYQNNSTTNSTTNGQQTVQQTDTNNKLNEFKKSNNNIHTHSDSQFFLNDEMEFREEIAALLPDPEKSEQFIAHYTTYGKDGKKLFENIDRRNFENKIKTFQFKDFSHQKLRNGKQSKNEHNHKEREMINMYYDWMQNKETPPSSTDHISCNGVESQIKNSEASINKPTNADCINYLKTNYNSIPIEEIKSIAKDFIYRMKVNSYKDLNPNTNHMEEVTNHNFHVFIDKLVKHHVSQNTTNITI